MLLLHNELERRISTGDIVFTGDLRKDSLLLSLGKYYQPLSRAETIIDPYNLQSSENLYNDLVSDWDQFELKPREFVLFSTAEYLSLGIRHYGLISTLSHIARLGLMAHAASCYVDREFDGYLTFEFVNLTDHSFLLRRNMPVAKLIICETTSPMEASGNYAVRPLTHYGKPNELKSRFSQEFSLIEKGEKNEQM
jgi:deoxycytidine triphosphate deaminase